MTKKCLGCGISLQTSDPKREGYVPDAHQDYCQRCFQIRNYNANIPINIKINNEELLLKIKQKKYFVLFLTDFLNLNEEVINTYHKITNDKILVITKEDIIPKNIIRNTLKNNIKRIYNIKEEIIFFNKNNKYNHNYLKELISLKKKVMLCGFTSSGKSTLINTLTNNTITVSNYANTTLSFIKVPYNDAYIIDTLGFINSNDYNINYKKQIKPRCYQLKENYELLFLNFKINMDRDNNLTFYINNDIEVRKKKRSNYLKKIWVNNNSDLIIKGIGFIKVKKEGYLFYTGDIEIRSSIVGG